MYSKAIHQTLTMLIAAVWFINGLVCKVLQLVPRHEAIVARILGPAYAEIITILIGSAEILMALWIVSNIKSRISAQVQIVIISAMNLLEFLLAPDLLLWGRFNLLFAGLLVLTIYFNEYKLKGKIT